MLDFNSDKIVYVSEDEQEYSAKDIFAICGEIESLAERVFFLCDWQHPATIMDELGRELDEMQEQEIVDYCKALDDTRLTEIWEEYEYIADANESTSRNIREFAEKMVKKNKSPRVHNSFFSQSSFNSSEITA